VKYARQPGADQIARWKATIAAHKRRRRGRRRRQPEITGIRIPSAETAGRRVMSGVMRKVAAAMHAKAGPPPLPQPRGCPVCFEVFASESAWSVHFEAGPGTRCLPKWRFAPLLVERSGVWCLAGSDAARK
jgi:hypothetical protein